MLIPVTLYSRKTTTTATTTTTTTTNAITATTKQVGKANNSKTSCKISCNR